jgi:hypothetical protein
MALLKINIGIYILMDIFLSFFYNVLDSFVLLFFSKWS